MPHHDFHMRKMFSQAMQCFHKWNIFYYLFIILVVYFFFPSLCWSNWKWKLYSGMCITIAIAVEIMLLLFFKIIHISCSFIHYTNEQFIVLCDKRENWNRIFILSWGIHNFPISLTFSNQILLWFFFSFFEFKLN